MWRVAMVLIVGLHDCLGKPSDAMDTVNVATAEEKQAMMDEMYDAAA
jgi:hypothetical protein